MADLIIKPEATSGNKLIFQDQAGGAVLTTADSGATLGNSTQDNITRLGTVTTGTMNNTIGSGAAMPAGRVLNVSQLWLGSDTGVWGQHGTSNGQSWTTFWTASYTPTLPSVKVYAMLHPWLRVWANVTTNNHVNFRYTIAGSNVTAGTGTNIGQASAEGMIWGDWGANSASYWRHTTHNMMVALRDVTTSGGTAAITYTLQCQNPNAINGNCGWTMYGDSFKEQTSMLFMEVEY